MMLAFISQHDNRAMKIDLSVPSAAGQGISGLMVAVLRMLFKISFPTGTSHCSTL
jgi:hypothetical protein